MSPLTSGFEPEPPEGDATAFLCRSPQLSPNHYWGWTATEKAFYRMRRQGWGRSPAVLATSEPRWPRRRMVGCRWTLVGKLRPCENEATYNFILIKIMLVLDEIIWRLWFPWSLRTKTSTPVSAFPHFHLIQALEFDRANLPIQTYWAEVPISRDNIQCH